MADDKDDAAGGPKGPPVCPECKRPVDDIEAMTEPELLEAIHLGVLRDLARTVRSGEASHQELAIARGLLRDNKKVVPPGDEKDDALPGQGEMPLPPREFKKYSHDE